MYKLKVANDFGITEQKININGVLYRQPSVNAVVHTKSIRNESIESVVANLHNNIDVKIQSESISFNNRYLVGESALNCYAWVYLRNMPVEFFVEKHKDDLPVVNTLGILAAIGVQKRFDERKKLDDGETIKLEVEMTTTLPASIFNDESEQEFRQRFMDNYHKVSLYVKDISVNVHIVFSFVKVMREGVSSLFTLMEDGNDNYRNDDMFVRFNREYNKTVDGSYFLDKRVLHLGIGDGSIDLVYTKGYSADIRKSFGEKYGFGKALEKAVELFSQSKGLDISRQRFSYYLKNKKHKYHESAKECLEPFKMEVAYPLYFSLLDRLKALNYEVDVVLVYGGGSILLEDILYKKIKQYLDGFGIELLWVPEEYSVDMNVNGMKIYSDIMDEASNT